MKIAFDFDDVISNTAPVMRRKIICDYDYDFYTAGNFEWVIPGYTRNKTLEIIKKTICDATSDIFPCRFYNLLFEFVHVCLKEPVLLVTARSLDLREATHQWADLYFNVPYEIIFAEKKEEVVLSREIDNFVDDRYKTVISLSEICEFVYLINNPWNIGRDVPNNVKRVNSLNEIFLKLMYEYNTNKDK